MKIAVLSGKGGTGKTFVSVNLAACAGNALYLDCDVEEPNGHLFLVPEEEKTEKVYTFIPEFSKDRCTGCRKCVDFCHFNALAFLFGKPVVFPEVCHSCGGCSIVCPSGAVTEAPKEVGEIITGKHKEITTITGKLNIGEASGIPVISGVLDKIPSDGERPVIIDCPPGSACSVMESISLADYCIIVAEPTAFGLHNFRMVHELTEVLDKPCGVVINKATDDNTLLEDLCREKNIPLLCRIPYKKNTAENGANAKIASETDPELEEVFNALYKKLQEVVK